MRTISFVVFTVICFFLLNNLVKADTLPQPWSKVIHSKDGKYVFVMISPFQKELDEYAIRLKNLWKSGGIPKENIPGAESTLQSELDRERKIRQKYPKSGLYKVRNEVKLLWELDLYDVAGDGAVKVLNDGEHLIYHRTYIAPIFDSGKKIDINANTQSNSESQPNPEEIILTFYSFGKIIRSYKTKDLVSEKLERGMNGFFTWSNPGILDEKSGNFLFTKKDNEKMAFEIRTGNIIEGNLPNQQNLNQEEKHSIESVSLEKKAPFCGGVAVLFTLILSILFGR